MTIHQTTADEEELTPKGRRFLRKLTAATGGGMFIDGFIFATHGTPYSYDTHVPLIIMGGGIKSGRYLAPPVRRAHIPKADGRTRPLGIPTFEDKVAQRAILTRRHALQSA